MNNTKLVIWAVIGCILAVTYIQFLVHAFHITGIWWPISLGLIVGYGLTSFCIDVAEILGLR